MRILVIGPAWVGDMIMAHALVRALHARHANLDGCEVDLVAPRLTAPLAERMPGVSAVERLDVAHGELGWRPRRQLAARLRSRDFDQAIVLPNSFKSALLPWLARIPLRTGWRGEWRYGLLNDLRPDPRVHPRQVERFVALAAPAAAVPSPVQTPTPTPLPQLQAQAGRAAELRAGLRLHTDAPVLVCCPGAAFGPAKQWPARHWAALITSQLNSQDGEVWLLGSRADAGIVAAIMAALPAPLASRARDLTGRTGLLDALDLMSLAARVVSNDSGLMHMAAALGVPVLGLFGSSSAEFTPPLALRAEALSLQLPCQPCFQRDCPLGHTACLHELTPARVGAALQRLVAGAGDD